MVGEDNDWLKMQYTRDISTYVTGVTGDRHIRTMIKPTSPPSRTSTGTTAALSPSSSHSMMTESTRRSGCGSPRQSTQRLVLLEEDDYGMNDHIDIPLEEPEHNSFSRLLRLSQRYRARCLQLGTRYQWEDARTSPCLLQDSIGVPSDALSQQNYRTSSRKTPLPLSSASSTRHGQAMRNPKLPYLPPLPSAASNQHRVGHVARKQEDSSEADRKPTARKHSPSISESTSFKTTPYHQATRIATLPYRPFVAETPMVNRELRHDITDQFHLDAFDGLDSEDVRRQQEILEDIQERNRLAKTAPCKQPKAQRPSCGMAADINTRPSLASLQQALHQERQAQARRNSPSQSSAVAGPPLSFNAMVGDQFTRLSNGKKIRVKSSRHTYKSIIQGKATLVQCPVCQTVSQISDTAKLLYCTACQQVSPIGTSTTTSAAAGMNVAGANSRTTDPSAAAALACCDDQIACVLQRQEINVAHVMKQAKQVAG